MSINNDYYQQIINDYPEYVNKEQFYKIAHISKKTAQYLLQSKKVPCVESNKKTRKYKIKVLDIVSYLIDRELHPEYYLPSCSQKSNFIKHSFLYYKMRSMNENEILQLKNYLIKKLIVLDDILTIKDIADFLGISYKSVSRRCTKGSIFSFLINGKRLIPKICLIDYLLSDDGFLLVDRSLKYNFFINTYYENL